MALNGLLSEEDASAVDSQSSKIILRPEASIPVCAALPSGIEGVSLTLSADSAFEESDAVFLLFPVSCSANFAISLLSEVRITFEFLPVKILQAVFAGLIVSRTSRLF